ncbi:MAG: YceI family protein [Chloroflexi bacterium]|nr:YceI family protein [Chloroflexota bacterium]
MPCSLFPFWGRRLSPSTGVPSPLTAARAAPCSIVNVEIDAASINTREPQRDGHLKSPDFLNAAEYPALTFKSKRVQKLDEAHGRIVGDLTIRGTTREVALEVEYNGQAKSPWGSTSAGFTASTKINRKDWDLNWNVALETSGWLVGDEVSISIELEIIKQAEAAPEAIAVAA